MKPERLNIILFRRSLVEPHEPDEDENSEPDDGSKKREINQNKDRNASWTVSSRFSDSRSVIRAADNLLPDAGELEKPPDARGQEAAVDIKNSAVRVGSSWPVDQERQDRDQVEATAGDGWPEDQLVGFPVLGFAEESVSAGKAAAFESLDCNAGVVGPHQRC